jgi:acyl-CoA dehydrogenase
MDFDFPADTLMLRDMLRRFVEKEARPLEMKYFNSGALEPEERARLRRAIEQLGLWGILAPEEFGGGGLDAVTGCMLEEELGKTFLPVDLGEPPAVLYACAGRQVREYLEPAMEGSRRGILALREPAAPAGQPEALKSSATPGGEVYLLNGRKRLSVAPEPQDFLIVYANIPSANLENGAQSGLTAFLVDANASGLRLHLQPEKRVSPELILEDCPVSREQVLGEPGQALSLGAAAAPLAWIRLGARYIGMAHRLVEMSVAHAQEWVSLGAALSVRPAICRMLAELRVDVESARWLVYHAAWSLDSGKCENPANIAAQVRLGTGEMLKRAIDRTTMIFAGPGPAPEIEPGRLARSLVPAEALEVSLEYARARVAAGLLSAGKD